MEQNKQPKNVMPDAWEEQLRRQLDGHEEAVPDGLWADVEASLATEGAIKLPLAPSSLEGELFVNEKTKTEDENINKKPARIVLLGRWLLGTAAVAALLLTLTYTRKSVKNDSSAGEDHMESILVNQRNSDDNSLLSPEGIQKEEVPIGVSVGKANRVFASLPKNSMGLTPHPSIPDAMLPLAPSSLEGNLEGEGEFLEGELASDTVSQTVAVAKETFSDSTVHFHPSPYNPFFPPEKRKTKRENKLRFTASLLAQNGLGGNAVQHNDVLMYNSLQNYNYNNHFDAETASAKRMGTYLLPGYEESADYDRPFIVGADVACALSERWTIHAGVDYIQTATRFIQKMGSTVLTTRQKLVYISVPVKVSYTLWKHKSLKVYGMAGVEAAFNVKNSSTTSGVESSLDRDDVQWSVISGAGVSYDFTPQFGVYAEPGLTYYFDNGSAVDNIFKHHPAAMQLQFGLRCHLNE